MNQILVTKKLYVTPELRRKKVWYKIQFSFALLLVCLLFSYYIYAEYDRNASEEISQQISAQMQSIKQENTVASIDTTVRKSENDVIIIAIDDEEEMQEQIIDTQTTDNETTPNQQASTTTQVTTASGTYSVESRLVYERLGIDYYVLTETSEELLKISVNKYWGPEPNKVGNYCIVGHNYKNKKMFGRLNEAINGDIIKLTDNAGNTVEYTVYDRYVVSPTDTSCTSQLTNGKREITLITCTNYGQERLVVKAREQ